MLFICTVTKFQGVSSTGLVRSSSGTEMLLNTNRVNRLLTRDTTKSKFRYNLNLFDRRSTGEYVECDSSVATIVTAFAATWQTSSLAFYYYPKADTDNTPVLIYITAESIALCIADSTGSADRSWMYIYDGAGKLNKLLIMSSLDQILQIADIGTTSTTH